MIESWKVVVILAWTVACFAVGVFVADKFHEAAMAKALQAQIDADRRAMQEVNDHAADLEKELAGERQKETQINLKMEAALANVPDCPVPIGLVRVLNEALAAPAPPR